VQSPHQYHGLHQLLTQFFQQVVAADIGGSTLAIDITATDAGEKIKTAAAKQGGLS
jgi:hypothetical protein